MICEVTGDGNKAPACCCHEARSLVHRRATDADDLAACLGDGDCNSLPDAGIGAGDHDAAARKAEHGEVCHLRLTLGSKFSATPLMQ